MEKEIFRKIKNKRMKVLKYKDTPKRDKMAIMISFLGLSVFKLSWFLYSKMTNRIS